MNGFINLNKPSGITSRDAVNVVRRMLPRKTKIGHAGTLDPLANGVLVIAVGSATRLIEYAQEGRKTYRAEFLLGRSSDTEDVEGAVVELENPTIPTRESLPCTLKFCGYIVVIHFGIDDVRSLLLREQEYVDLIV